MKKGLILCLAVFGIVFAGCHSDDDLWGDWGKWDPVAGSARVGAVSFKIGDEIFVGLGYDKDTEPLNTFYKSSDGRNWKTVKSFEGKGRIGAVAFVLNGKAYVGTGYIPSKTNVTKEYLKDFYCYDPVADSWTQVADMATDDGAGRWQAVAFSVKNANGKEFGIVGCGSTNSDKEYYNDFYTFDGTNWESLGSFGRKRRGGTAFVINNAAYVCTGFETGTSGLAPDMLKFDGNTWAWTELRKIVDATDDDFDDDYNTIQRAFAVSFVAKNDGVTRGYLATGTNGSLLKNCWEYNPGDDTWDEVNPLPSRMSPRVNAVSFTVGDYGFIALGSTSIAASEAQFDDVWRFVPTIDEDDKNDY